MRHVSLLVYTGRYCHRPGLMGLLWTSIPSKMVELNVANQFKQFRGITRRCTELQEDYV